MKKNMSRRDFLKWGARGFWSSVAISACGQLLSPFAQAQPKKEIKVDQTGFITDISTLSEEKALDFDYEGKRSILLYNEGEIRAFENICTHRKGPSSLRGKTLVCQWHGARFDPLTGEAIGGPAPTGSKLTAIPLDVTENKVFVARATEKTGKDLPGPINSSPSPQPTNQ